MSKTERLFHTRTLVIHPDFKNLEEFIVSIPAVSDTHLAIWNATRNKGETQIVARYAFTDMNFKLCLLYTSRCV